MFSENTALSERRDAGPPHGPGAVLRERFVLEERLEHGRLGVVYRAVDRQRSSNGDSFVAVLILPPEITRNAAQLDAFKRELGSVQSLSLSHPHIVDIYDFDRDGSTCFLVMEWLDGESLRRVIDSLSPEPLCEEDVLGVIRAVGEALVYAHAKGIVHGDVRAENVIVTGQREVKLLFGSACLARSAPFAVGPQEDLQGLAALTYEMLSGEPPPAIAGYVGARGKPVEPPRIAGLSRKRWKALKSALVRRDPRLRTVRQFLAAFDAGEPARHAPARRPSRRAALLRAILRRGAIGAGLLIGLAVVVAGAGLLWREAGSDVRELSSRWASSSLAIAGGVAEDAREAMGMAIRRATESARTGIASLREAAPTQRASSPADSTGESAADSTEMSPQSATPTGSTTPSPGEIDDAASASAAHGDSDGGAESDHAPEPVTAPEAAAGIAIGSADDASARAIAPDGEAETGARGAIDAGTEPSEASLDQPGIDGSGATANRSEARPNPSEGGRPSPAQAARGEIGFAQSQFVVIEGQAVAVIEVRRAGDAEGAMDVVWWTRDGSATAGDDYADLGRVVERLRDGEASRMLFVPITSDSIPERQEDFDVYVGPLSPQGNQSGSVQSARVTILDDDA